MSLVILRENNLAEPGRKLHVSLSPLWRRLVCFRLPGTKRGNRPLSARDNQRRKPKRTSAHDGGRVLRHRGRHAGVVRTSVWAGPEKGVRAAGCRQQAARCRSSGASPGGRRDTLRAQRQSTPAIVLTSARPPGPLRAGFGLSPSPRRKQSPPPACRAGATGTRGRASSPPLRPTGLSWRPCLTVRRSGKICNPLTSPS